MEIVRLQKAIAVAKVRCNEMTAAAALARRMGCSEDEEVANVRCDAAHCELAHLRELLKTLVLAKETALVEKDKPNEKRSECDAKPGSANANTQSNETEFAKQTDQAKAATGKGGTAADAVVAEIAQLRQENAQLSQKLEECEAAKKVAQNNAVAAALCAQQQAFRVMIKRSHGRPEMLCYYKTMAGAEEFKKRVGKADALLRSKTEEPFISKVEITKIVLYADDEDPTWKC